MKTTDDVDDTNPYKERVVDVGDSSEDENEEHKNADNLGSELKGLGGGQQSDVMSQGTFLGHVDNSDMMSTGSYI